MIRIPPFKYSFDEEDASFMAKSVSDLLLSGDCLTLGPHGEMFEFLFAREHGAEYAVAVSSGTAALEILLRAADVSGRKVVVPSNTYGATLVAVLKAGGHPLLADCGQDFSLDPLHVENLLGPEVAAVVVVHIGGHMSAALPRLCAVCERHGIPLIEDAAHATGSKLSGRAAGNWGLGAAFSFFSTKVVTCGEGGMLVTRDARVRDLGFLLRDHAKRPDGAMDIVGYNWRLSELQALLGIVQIKKLSAILASRRRIAEYYAACLEGLPHVSLVESAEGAAPNYYKQIVRVPMGLRDQIRRRLKTEFDVSLGGEVYAVPCHLQAAFKEYAVSDLPMAELLCSRHICPPIYPTMSAEEMVYACTSLRTVLTEELEIWERTARSLAD